MLFLWGTTKQDTSNMTRKARMRQNLGQIIDKVTAAKAGNAGHLGLGRFLKKKIFPSQQRLAEETLAAQPVQCGGMEIIAGAQVRLPGPVADDVHPDTPGNQAL